MTASMNNTFTAILERDDDWYVAYCPEVPGRMVKGAQSKMRVRA